MSAQTVYTLAASRLLRQAADRVDDGHYQVALKLCQEAVTKLMLAQLQGGFMMTDHNALGKLVSTSEGIVRAAHGLGVLEAWDLWIKAGANIPGAVKREAVTDLTYELRRMAVELGGAQA